MSDSNHVEKISEWASTVMHISTCSCGSHNIRFSVECDNGMSPVLYLYYDVANKIPVYGSCTWYEDFWIRIKSAVRILFGQTIEFEEAFYFSDEKHIRDFINALEFGIKHVKQEADLSNTNVK